MAADDFTVVEEREEVTDAEEIEENILADEMSIPDPREVDFKAALHGLYQLSIGSPTERQAYKRCLLAFDEIVKTASNKKNKPHPWIRRGKRPASKMTSDSESTPSQFIPSQKRGPKVQNIAGKNKLDVPRRIGDGNILKAVGILIKETAMESESVMELAKRFRTHQVFGI